MGEQTDVVGIEPETRRVFARQVLREVRGLARLLEEGHFDDHARRLGAEQELVFVDRHARPAPVGLEVLERLNDDRFTTELSLFNVEFNCPPLAFGGDCLRRLETELSSALTLVRAAAAPLGARPVLTGILPTLSKSDLELSNITPRPRYYALVNALRETRGEAYEFRIAGPDELIMRHESVMLEAANTSFQLHWQVRPDELALAFNAAQAVAGPILAAAVNAPLLFGHRLWRETRIALFQQSIDTRQMRHALETRSGRVRFGEAWVRGSALELIEEDIARFRVLLAEDVDEDPMAVIDAGGIPSLRALRLHLGTVYRWNRLCYGETNGRPHFRIENRVLPSGPTVVDEVANAAFWYGLLIGVLDVVGDVTTSMSFDDAQSNFNNAARLGLEAPLAWFGGPPTLARDLILNELLPLARTGLAGAGVDAADIDHYLGIIAERVGTRRTGARWMLDGLRDLRERETKHQALGDLVVAMVHRQEAGTPVHEWTPVNTDKTQLDMSRYLRVEQLMTTDVFRVGVDDDLDLVAAVMDWKYIRHIPVEDAEHRLVGLVSYRQLLRFLAHGGRQDRTIPVRELMQSDPLTATPETPTLDALRLMRDRGVSCLPVVRGDRLVGILTNRDLMPIASQLLEERLRDA